MGFDVRLPFGPLFLRFGILPNGYRLASSQSLRCTERSHRRKVNACSSVVLPCCGWNRLRLSRLPEHKKASRAAREPGKVRGPQVISDKSRIVMKVLRSLPT